MSDIGTAFARNIAWLASVYPIIPRHLIFVGLDVRGFGYRELSAELRRWEPVLEGLPTGDYRLTPEGERRIGELMALPAARASSN
jgi:hypothetical protein